MVKKLDEIRQAKKNAVKQINIMREQLDSMENQLDIGETKSECAFQIRNEIEEIVDAVFEIRRIFDVKFGIDIR